MSIFRLVAAAVSSVRLLLLTRLHSEGRADAIARPKIPCPHASRTV